MAFRVQVGPPHISVHQGQTVLLTQESGEIGWPSDHGLYFRDTRVVSSWSVYADGAEWDLLNGGAIAYDTARIFLTNREVTTREGVIPPRTLGFQISRAVEGGMHEDLDITNHGTVAVRFNLEIALRCDFADIFEVKSGKIIRRGLIRTEWDEGARVLTNAYVNGDFARSVAIRAEFAEPVYANGRLSFDVAIKPGERWHCCLHYALADGETDYQAPGHCANGTERSEAADSIAEWRQTVLKVETTNEEFYRLYTQAVEDMGAMRLPIAGTDHMVFLPAAGLPWFVAPFGRDSLIVSLQNLLVYPEFARGSLEILGQLQATEDDAYRDAEPGKILHELRYGELAHFKLIPHTPYYGTADATPLWLITLHATWCCTGDKGLLESLLPVAENCLRWIDESGDRDGDGFQEYQTRSSAGYENMAWKDSGDAVMYEDGRLVKGPKALCELQGYVYDAWLRMAEVYDALGREDRAGVLREKANRLYRKFNEVFWDEERQLYAYTLDGEKRPVFSVASNMGHCLWSGIVPRARARAVMERLTADDMWSGWGVRTLSNRHVNFNPYAYQLGSVWPHDNAIIAMGFARYGFREEAARIARDISEAGSHFQANQLPELYGGMTRGAAGFPVQYLGANVPQAWAAGSVFLLLQAMLGIVPAAPRGKLFVDPALPHWLSEITLTDLRVGEEKFDLRFERREDGETTYEVLRGDAGMVERRAVGEALATEAAG